MPELVVGLETVGALGDETAKSFGVVGWTLFSRVTGLLRVMVAGAILGPTFFANIFQATNTIPNLTYNLMAGSLLTELIIPILVAELDTGGLSETRRLLRQIVGVVLAGFAAAALAVTLASPVIVRLLTSKCTVRGNPTLRTRVLGAAVPRAATDRLVRHRRRRSGRPERGVATSRSRRQPGSREHRAHLHVDLRCGLLRPRHPPRFDRLPRVPRPRRDRRGCTARRGPMLGRRRVSACRCGRRSSGHTRQCTRSEASSARDRYRVTRRQLALHPDRRRR